MRVRLVGRCCVGADFMQGVAQLGFFRLDPRGELFLGRAVGLKKLPLEIGQPIRTGDQQVTKQVGQFLRIRSGEAVAAFDLEIEVRQRRRFRALEVDGQTQPQPQLGDVDGERVNVHAVQVVLDDLQLAAVDGHGVQALGRKERGSQP